MNTLPSQAPQDLMEAGHLLVEAGVIARAFDHFMAMPRGQGALLEGALAAARLHADLGNFSACFAVYDLLHQEGCTRAQERALRAQRAEHALKAGRIAEALADYIWIAAYQPDQPLGFVGQIKVHLQTFDKAAAQEALRRAKALFPQDLSVRGIEARLLCQYGEEADLLSFLSQSLRAGLSAAALHGLLKTLFGDRKYYFSAELRQHIAAQLNGHLDPKRLETLLPAIARDTAEVRLASALTACQMLKNRNSPSGLQRRIRLAKAQIEAGEGAAALKTIADLAASVAGWPYSPPILAEVFEWQAAQAGDWAKAKASYWQRRRMQAVRDRSDELECLRLLPEPPPEVVVFCQLRNERPVLPAFFEHYRSLGVTRFVMIDNGSQDGSCEWLLAQPDVELYRTYAPFRRAEAGNAWTNPLIARPEYAKTLCLRVDADEHLVYAHCQTRPLSELWRFMQAEGAEVLAGHMLDMLPRTIKDMEAAGEDLAAMSWYFETDLTRNPTFACPYFNVMGQARARLITGRETHLTKCSGLRGGGSIEQQRASHRASPAQVSQVGMILLHYKFRPDFFSRAERVSQERHYASGSQEFSLYANLRDRPEADLRGGQARAYLGPSTLIAEGVLSSTPAWDSWA